MNRRFQFTLRTLMLLVVLVAALCCALRLMPPLWALGVFLVSVQTCLLICIFFGPRSVKVIAVGFWVMPVFLGEHIAPACQDFFERFFPVLDVVQETPTLIRTISHRPMALGLAASVIISGTVGGCLALLLWYKLGVARLADWVINRLQWRR